MATCPDCGGAMLTERPHQHQRREATSRTTEVHDDYTVGVAMRLMHAEKQSCPTCQRTSEGPPHFRTHIFHDENGYEYLYTRRCESDSRIFDERTMTLRGRAHCSCDTCF